MKVQGEIKIRILIDSEGLLNEFENAYRSLMKKGFGAKITSI